MGGTLFVGIKPVDQLAKAAIILDIGILINLPDRNRGESAYSVTLSNKFC